MRRFHHRLLFTLCVCALAGQTVTLTAQAPMHPFAGSLTVIHNFNTAPDGSFPTGRLTMDSAGALYGVTEKEAQGCPAGASWCGVVFQLTPPTIPGGPWSETILHTFDAAPDGVLPTEGVVLDSAGAVYGTTTMGGLGFGTVFKLTPPKIPGGVWAETIVHAFKIDRGTSPTGVRLGMDGNLYGNTSDGFVFQLSPPVRPHVQWTYKVLYNTGAVDNSPGVILAPDGTIYCAAKYPERVFQVKPPTLPGGSWAGSTIYTFTSLHQGSGLNGDLLFDQATGALYGTALQGGSNLHSKVCDLGCGTAFMLTPPSQPGGVWTEATIHNFDPVHGFYPLAGLVADSRGYLYGTTTQGGSAFQYFDPGGIVFKLTPPQKLGGAWSETVLHDFSLDGNFNPTGVVTLDTSGTIYGTTMGDGQVGSYPNGTVFQIAP